MSATKITEELKNNLSITGSSNNVRYFLRVKIIMVEQLEENIEVYTKSRENIHGVLE